MSSCRTLYLSIGAEHRPIPNAYLRVELRNTTATNGLQLFINDEGFTDNRLEALITIGLELDRILSF